MLLFFHIFHIFFPTTIHIIAISIRVSIEYINIGDIKKLTIIGTVAGKSIASMLPTEII